MFVKASLACAALALGFLGGTQAHQLVTSSGEPQPADRAIDPAARAEEVVFEDCPRHPDGPPYPVNDTGMTYGSGAGIDEDDPGPDLIAAYGTNGRCGFIRSADRDPGPQTLEEVRSHLSDPDPVGYDIPLYERDGVTVIGVFHVGPGRTLTSGAPEP